MAFSFAVKLAQKSHWSSARREKTQTLWCSKHLHGLDWNSDSLKFRFPDPVFYAKGDAKCNHLHSHFFNTVDLELVNCPKVTEFVSLDDTIY